MIEKDNIHLDLNVPVLMPEFHPKILCESPQLNLDHFHFHHWATLLVGIFSMSPLKKNLESMNLVSSYVLTF